MIIDSHVNLHAPQFADDVEAVIARARQAGVGLMLTICDKVSSFEAVHALAMAHADIWCTVGAHPHEAKEDPDLAVEALTHLAARPKVVGIGECGLDFHYDLSPRAVQIQVFRVHVAAAGLAKRAAALGAWFSVSGIATFKAAEAVRAVIADMPADRIIVETDCPYLAPVPFRGRRNEPAYVGHVLAKLAEIRGWSVAEAEQQTEEAFFALFDAIPRSAAQEVGPRGVGL